MNNSNSRKLDVGEQPQPGQLYVCYNHELKVYKDFHPLSDDPSDAEDSSNNFGFGYGNYIKGIPRGEMFFFVGVTEEQKVPGQIKKVWFRVIHKEMIGYVYNGQIPFHQFFQKVEEE